MNIAQRQAGMKQAIKDRLAKAKGKHPHKGKHRPPSKKAPADSPAEEAGEPSQPPGVSANGPNPQDEMAEAQLMMARQR